MTTRHSNRKQNWQGMNWIRKDKRLAIYLRDGMACVYCGAGVETGAKLTLDHVKCVVRGGSNHANNLLTCCFECNVQRNDTLFDDWLAQIHTVNIPDILSLLKADLKPFRKQAKAILARRSGNFRAICQKTVRRSITGRSIIT